MKRKPKGIEDVLTCEMLREFMRRDPNRPLGADQDFTEEHFQMFIKAIKGTPIEQQMVEALDGVDMDLIQFTDLKIQTEH